jgi:hypothetical protein
MLRIYSDACRGYVDPLSNSHSVADRASHWLSPSGGPVTSRGRKVLEEPNYMKTNANSRSSSPKAWFASRSDGKRVGLQVTLLLLL